VSRKSVYSKFEYCPRQFTCCLHSIVVILVQFVVAWFMQWDGGAGIHQSRNILHAGVHFVVTLAHCSLYVFWRNVIFYGSTEQSESY
jgi:hypothetical protein